MFVFTRRSGQPQVVDVDLGLGHRRVRLRHGPACSGRPGSAAIYGRRPGDTGALFAVAQQAAAAEPLIAGFWPLARRDVRPARGPPAQPSLSTS